MDVARAHIFASSVFQKVLDLGLDGVNLDWWRLEYPVCGAATDASALVTILKSLRIFSLAKNVPMVLTFTLRQESDWRKVR